MNGRPAEAVTGHRLEVLSLLKASSTPLGIVEIADRLDLHPNTVRFHLEALVDRGSAERLAPSPQGPGRPPARYRAHRGMDPAGPRSYQLLAGVLAAAVADARDPVSSAEAAGRGWGSTLTAAESAVDDADATGRLVAILDDLGFEPESRPEGIGLRHCPFLELVEHQAGVVCPVHLGLMRGALGNLSSTVTVERLDPFVEPDLCLARLGPGAARRTTSGRPGPSRGGGDKVR